MYFRGLSRDLRVSGKMQYLFSAHHPTSFCHSKPLACMLEPRWFLHPQWVQIWENQSLFPMHFLYVENCFLFGKPRGLLGSYHCIWVLHSVKYAIGKWIPNLGVIYKMNLHGLYQLQGKQDWSQRLKARDVLQSSPGKRAYHILPALMGWQASPALTPSFKTAHSICCSCVHYRVSVCNSANAPWVGFHLTPRCKTKHSPGVKLLVNADSKSECSCTSGVSEEQVVALCC